MMLKLTKLCLLVSTFLCLQSCITTASTNSQESEKKIATAKINARLGIAYLEKQDVQRAKQKLLLALKQAPEIPETWYSMAYFQEATGNVMEANKDYLEAIKIAPGRGDAENNYGTFLCHIGKYQEAITHFLLATKDENYLNIADTYENAGVCALKIPNKQEAMYYFKQALREDPSKLVSANALKRLGEKP